VAYTDCTRKFGGKNVVFVLGVRLIKVVMVDCCILHTSLMYSSPEKRSRKKRQKKDLAHTEARPDRQTPDTICEIRKFSRF
jgi:hypothetical protein